MSADANLERLNIELPPAPKSVGVYHTVVVRDGLAYLSGHLPLQLDKTLITGRLGADLDTAAGYAAARQTGLTMLATMREHLGGLDRVAQLIKTVGMVQCTPDFTDIPAVINGCSELFRDVFGEEIGIGARSAVGMNALPLGVAVEIEAIVAVRS